MQNETRRSITEILLVGICTLAASIGPPLLIGAAFSLSFLTGGLVAALISLVIYNGVRRIEGLIENYFETGFSVIKILMGYVPFLLFVILRVVPDIREIRFLMQISRGDGLLNFPTIIGLLLLLTIYLSVAGKDLITGFAQAGTGYLLPLTLILLLMPLIPNSEGKVLLGNVALVYLSLRTVLSLYVEKYYKIRHC